MSILKPRKPRQPLQAVNLGHNEEEEDTAEVRRRRVSFAGINKIKEFNADAESVVICDTPAYEEEFTASSDSSQILKDLNSSNVFFKKSMDERDNSKESENGFSCVIDETVPVNLIDHSNYSSKTHEIIVPNTYSTNVYSHCQYAGQVNYLEDSMDITGLDTPESPKSEHCTSNMNLCGDSFMQDSPCRSQVNSIKQDLKSQMFHRSSVNSSKNDQSILSESGMSDQVNKENLVNHVSNYSEVVNDEPLTAVSFNSDGSNPVMPKGHALLNWSNQSGLSKNLSSQSPAHKRYRLSNLPTSDMEMFQIDSTRTCDQDSFEISFTQVAELQPGFGFHQTTDASRKNTSNISNPSQASTVKSSVTSNIFCYESPQSNDYTTDNREHQPNISFGKACNRVENIQSDGFPFVEVGSPIDDSVDAYRKEDESSGETMNLSDIAEKFLNLKKQDNIKNEVDVSKKPGNDVQATISQRTNVITSNKTLIENCMGEKNMSLLQLSSVDPTKNHTLSHDRNVSNCSVNPVPSHHELDYADIVESSFNSVKNESKRKLDILKMDDNSILKVPEARVDQVFSSASCIAVRHSQGWISDRIHSNVTLNKDIIEQNAFCNDINDDKSQVSKSLQKENSVNKSDSELHSGLMEMENLSHEPIIEVFHLQDDFENLSCEPYNKMSISNHKLCESINEKLNHSDLIHHKSNLLENEGCGTAVELSPTTEDVKNEQCENVNVISSLPDHLEGILHNSVIQESHSLENNVSRLDQKNEEDIFADSDGDNINEKELTSEKIPSFLLCEKDESISLPISQPLCISPVKNDVNVSVNSSPTPKQYLSSNESHSNIQVNALPDVLDDFVVTPHPESPVLKDKLIDAEPAESILIPVSNKDTTLEKCPVVINNENLNVINELVMNMSVSEEVSQSVMEEEHVDDSTSLRSTLSDVKLPGTGFSPLQWHNKNFMQDLNYHFWEWTEWTKKFFNKSVILTVKVPWVQFEPNTQIINVSLTPVVVAHDDALNFCSANLVKKIIDMKALEKFKFIDYSKEIFSLIQKEVDLATPFYESLHDAVFYKALKIINDRLVIRVVKFKPRILSFDVFISLANWRRMLTESDLSLKIFHGKVSLAQIKSIFSSIPKCKEKLYEFACALEKL